MRTRFLWRTICKYNRVKLSSNQFRQWISVFEKSSWLYHSQSHFNPRLINVVRNEIFTTKTKALQFRLLSSSWCNVQARACRGNFSHVWLFYDNAKWLWWGYRTGFSLFQPQWGDQFTNEGMEYSKIVKIDCLLNLTVLCRCPSGPRYFPRLGPRSAFEGRPGNLLCKSGTVLATRDGFAADSN